MKMVMIVYDASYDDAVREAIGRCGVQGFTLWRRVLGTGERSGAKMDDSIWPGYNHAMMTAVEDGPCADAVFADLADLKKSLGNKGLKVFFWPVEKMI